MGGFPDFVEAPTDNGPPPVDIARDAIPGLQPTDVVKIAGYPQQDDAPVIVIRDGKVIASYAFVRFEGKPWTPAGGSVCSGMGLRLL